MKVKIEKCPFCKGEKLVIGYQVSQGSVMSGKSGLVGSRVIHTICKTCGSIVNSRVEDTKIFKENLNEE
ncbi:transcription initiation factor TFIIIB [Clostridium sp.]|uniref:transcription initiation factor TFIIIB n=1 Tax=Clostridium sp. TaxID=1506 RepID=UPI0025B8483E|nr:transcription initiation factor TFIIIB [Clostridium sp.]